jgi:hypothetical protein
MDEEISINPEALAAGTPLLSVQKGEYDEYLTTIDGKWVQAELSNVADDSPPNTLVLIFGGGCIRLTFQLQEDGLWKLVNARSQNYSGCMRFKHEYDENGKPVKADEKTTALISGAIRETERLRKRMLYDMRQDAAKARAKHDRNIVEIERLQAENVELRKRF